MNEIEEKIIEIDAIINQNIDAIEYLSRNLVSENVLAQSRNLVELIAIKAYSLDNNDVTVDYNSIKNALDFIVTNDKYLFLRKFHNLLQKSKSHYTPTGDGSERLMLKYYDYYLQLRKFVKKEYNLDILKNLEKFPLNKDETLKNYYIQISESLKKYRLNIDFSKAPRVYVESSNPIYINDEILYENTIVPANDTGSKFDRLIVFSKKMIPDYYAIKPNIFDDVINIKGQNMPVKILVDYMVSIRPCEINNFSKIFHKNLRIRSSNTEYKNLMSFLTQSGSSIIDIILVENLMYEDIKYKILKDVKTKEIFKLLDEVRDFILKNKVGTNIIRYLGLIMRNKIIKSQINDVANIKLSNLNLKYECIPFEEMPFITSLVNHNPDFFYLNEAINSEKHKSELLIRSIRNNSVNNGILYTKIKDLNCYENLNDMINIYNEKLYHKHENRKIEFFGKDNLYVKEFYEDTKYIIDKIIEISDKGVTNYKESVEFWVKENPRNC